MKNDKETFDIYSVMKSKEISEYYRDNNIKLSPLEQECIIINSYNSLEKQLELLRQLEKTVEGDDKEKINSMISLYEYVITLFYKPEKVYNNGERFIYSVCYEKPYCNISEHVRLNNFLDTVNNSSEYFNSINKVIDYMKSDGRDRDSFNINLLISINNKELIYSMEFRCEKIDGKYVPFRFYFGHDFPENNIFSKACDRCNHPEINRLMLPFEGLCRVKFQTPNMNKPFYGMLHNEQDLNGTWYRFLYRDGITSEDIDKEFNYLDMSYLNLDLTSQYAIFDWLERA